MQYVLVNAGYSETLYDEGNLVIHLLDSLIVEDVAGSLSMCLSLMRKFLPKRKCKFSTLLVSVF